MAHYVENIGDEPVEMLEVFRASTFQDFSLEQWLAQSPQTMVVEHLNLDGDNAKRFIDSLSKKEGSCQAWATDFFFSLRFGICYIICAVYTFFKEKSFLNRHHDGVGTSEL